jgi:hypothetical protein
MSHDQDNWAPAIRHLPADGPGGLPPTLEGRELAGPLQGFGRMFQKTYRISMPGHQPEAVIAFWKQHFGELWPDDQRFRSPGVRLGEIGVIDGAHGPVRMETGVYVMYADERSFAFINPLGHPWSGWITFSADDDETGAIAQVSLLIRASDPIYDLGFTLLGGGHHEDEMWRHVLRGLAAHHGVEAEPTTEVRLVDKRRLWRHAGNVRYNAAIRGTISGIFGRGRARG